MVERVGSELARARTESERLAALVLDDRTLLAPMLERAAQLVSSTTVAQSKVRAARPLAADATSPAVAQTILQSCRSSLQRATEPGAEQGVDHHARLLQ